MEKFLHGIDTMNDKVGKVFRWSLVLLTLVMMFEVTTRYIFNAPTVWAFPVSTALYGMSFMMCGAYTLLWQGHVIIDIIYNKFSLRGKCVLDIITHIVFFYPFLIVLTIVGVKFAAKSWAIWETAQGVFQTPVFLVKTMIPLFAFLNLTQGTAIFIRAIFTLIHNKPMYPTKYVKVSMVQAAMEDMGMRETKKKLEMEEKAKLAAQKAKEEGNG